MQRREAEELKNKETQAIDGGTNQPESHFDPFDNPKTSTGLESKKVEVIKNPEAMLQRLQDAARNGSEKLNQFQEASELGKKRLEHPKHTPAHKSQVEELLALAPAELVEKLYAECVDNPRPELDTWNIKQLKKSLEGTDAETLKKVITAFKESKGQAKSLTYVLNKLDAWGITEFTMKKAG